MPRNFCELLWRVTVAVLLLQAAAACAAVPAPTQNHGPTDFAGLPLTAPYLERALTALKKEQHPTAELFCLPQAGDVVRESDQSPYAVRTGARIVVKEGAEVRKLIEIVSDLRVVKTGLSGAEPTFEIMFRRNDMVVFDAIFTEPAHTGDVDNRLTSYAVVDDRIAEVSGEPARELCRFMKSKRLFEAQYITC